MEQDAPYSDRIGPRFHTIFTRTSRAGCTTTESSGDRDGHPMAVAAAPVAARAQAATPSRHSRTQPEAPEGAILLVVQTPHESINRPLGVPQAISRPRRIHPPEATSNECSGPVPRLRWRRKRARTLVLHLRFITLLLLTTASRNRRLRPAECVTFL